MSVGAAYTRYADDLASSGGQSFEHCVERFSTHVAVILHEEASPLITARLVSYAKECANTWQAWSQIDTPMS